MVGCHSNMTILRDTISRARFLTAKLREPGCESTVEQPGQQEADDLALTGDPQWNIQFARMILTPMR